MGAELYCNIASQYFNPILPSIGDRALARSGVFAILLHTSQMAFPHRISGRYQPFAIDSITEQLVTVGPCSRSTAFSCESSAAHRRGAGNYAARLTLALAASLAAAAALIVADVAAATLFSTMSTACLATLFIVS